MQKIKRKFSVSWAQQIVDRHAQNTKVSAVRFDSLDIGTTSRVRLRVEHNNPETLPSRWFVKLPSQSWRARFITALPRLLPTEVRFYQELAPVVPLECPMVLAAHRDWGVDATLVLTDVTEQGAIVGSPYDALTFQQAVSVIEQLACLHARFWHKAGLEDADEWLSSSIRRWEDRLGSVLAVPLMHRGLRQAGEMIPIALYGPALDYARQRSKIMAALNSGPTTLIHHDLHPGNFYWQQSQPGFLDWQLVRVGEGLSDVAYFLATALAPATRRMHEQSLLARYQQVLAEQGIATYDAATLLARYQAHLLYPFEAMVLTLAVGGLMEREANLELIRRTMAALEDHDAFKFLTSSLTFNA
jgi:aminoglycoside phosphotransferase (APT) family kinase protein